MVTGGATGDICTAAGGAAGAELAGALAAGRGAEGVQGGSVTEVQAASNAIGASMLSARAGMRERERPSRAVVWGQGIVVIFFLRFMHA